MDPARWQRINQIFLAALERADDERIAFLNAECGDDHELRAEVDSLIAHHPATTDGFLNPAEMNVKQLVGSPFATTDPAAAPSTEEDETHSDGSSDHGRFLPGTKVADRYRIVSLLGRGGMGEVYRADDLKLGQTVALKFLPRELAGDKKRLELFHTEVRLTRQISHPNVCCVYDITEHDGQTFLSMEYIDGEDLGVLLRRIGRLPKDKGVQIAQQLCAGLAAAHDKGVLHRDLKPANIMLDGRGQVRIADFGLASLAEAAGQEIAGTPAYMAPEQLRHGRASIQSDLYALGLVLYELLTGKPVYKSGSIPELLKLHNDSTPANPSTLVDDMDPVIERVILRCLEKDPQLRPTTAYEIAAALPGGDPLVAALAAGETPSPEMVAAAGGIGGLDPRIACGLLACVFVGLMTVCFLTASRDTFRRVARKHPQVFAAEARDIINALGYDESPRDSSWQFSTTTNDSHSRWDPLERSAIYFWYRQSPELLIPRRLFAETVRLRSVGAVSLSDPPMTVPGMIMVRLNESGHLIEFQAIPNRGKMPDAARSDDRVFNVLLRQSDEVFGFSLSSFDSASPQWAPATAYDTRRAWRGVDSQGIPIRVEAAGFHGKIVQVRVLDDRSRSTDNEDDIEAARDDVFAGGYFVGMFAGIALAVINLRRARGDRVGAMRLATYMAACSILIWLLAGHHVASLAGELEATGLGMVWSIYIGFELWCCYLALEPFVRRIWPQLLITWTRILNGRVRDPLVGQHLLIGVTVGVAVKILLHFGNVSQPRGEVHYAPLIVGLRDTLSWMLAAHFEAIRSGLFSLVFLMMVVALVRRQWIAGIVLGGFLLFVFYGVMNASAVSILFRIAVATLVVTVLMRFGLLAWIAAIFTARMLMSPMTIDPAAWNFGSGMTVLLIIFAIAAYGFYTSFGKRGGKRHDCAVAPR